MQPLLSLLEPGNVAIYLMSILLGLYVQYQSAKTNGRTTATRFWDYWLKETPGMSLATVVVLVTVAGATIQSGMLTAMTGWAVFSMGFLKGFGFDALIQAPSTGPIPPKQAGFARLSFLVLLAALSLALSGCGSVPTTTDLPDSKVLPMPGNEALKAIVVAKELLDISYQSITDGVNQDLIAPLQARKWVTSLDEYRAKLAEAEKLFSLGSFDMAKVQAEGTKALIKIIHDEAIKAVQRNNLKPVKWMLSFEVQPVWRREWIY